MSFFSKAVEKLNIEGYSTVKNLNSIAEDPILNAIMKFKNHPSIIKIKENIEVTDKFSFPETNDEDMVVKIKRLNNNKPTTFNNIPAKLLKQPNDMCSPFLTKIYNETKGNGNFPNALKMADVISAYKKGETTNKDNYRPVSVFPTVS